MSALLRFSLLLAFFIGINAQSQPPRVATSVLVSRDPLVTNPSVGGLVVLTETDAGLRITGALTGLSPGNYSVRVHERGDISTCNGASNVFPAQANDLATVEITATVPVANIDVTNSVITLRGSNDVVGRSVVVHAAQGNARVVCGVIGIMSPLTAWNSAITSAPSLFLFITSAIFAYFRM